MLLVLNAFPTMAQGESDTTIYEQDCSPATTLPWHETFEDGIDCWYQPEGGKWFDTYYEWYYPDGSHRYLRLGLYDSGWIMSKAIVLPSDTSTHLILEWQVLSANNSGGWAGEYYEVLVSTSTDRTDTTAYTSLMKDYAQHNPYGSWGVRDTMQVSLDDYAGQTIYIAFRSPYCTGLNIDDVEVRTTLIPRVSIVHPSAVNSHEPALFTAHLAEGSTAGLTYTWHSTLMDTTASDSTLSLTYLAGGTDTIRLIATNSYGSDTATAIIAVNDCAPLSIPFVETFATTIAQPYNVDGSIPTCWNRYWNGAAANAPHVANGYPYSPIKDYLDYNKALLLMAAYPFDEWDSVATVETPTFADSLSHTALVLTYLGEYFNTTPLCVGYMAGGNFVSIAELPTTHTWQCDTVPLTAFPDTVHRIALQFRCSQSYYYAVIVSKMELLSLDPLPSVKIQAPTTALVGDALTIAAQMMGGLPDSLHFTWHSTLLDSTWTTTATSSTLVYHTLGSDTLQLVSTNAYGSDTAWATIAIAAPPLPSVELIMNTTIRAHETTTYLAKLEDVHSYGLSCTWHSSLLDTTATHAATSSSTLDEFDLVYPTGGYDTLSLTMANPFDTLRIDTVVYIYDCSFYTLPFHEDFSTDTNSFPCWEKEWEGGWLMSPHTVTVYNTDNMVVDSACYLELCTGSTTWWCSTVSTPAFPTSLNSCTLAIEYRADSLNTAFYGSGFSIGYYDQDGTYVPYKHMPFSSTKVHDTISLAGLPSEVHSLAMQWCSGYSNNLEIYQVHIYTEDTATLYTVSATPADPAMGSVSGSGTYEDGSTATLIATAYEGFHFVQWNDGDTANPRTIVVSADTVLVAHFEADSTADTTTLYTVSATPADPAMGSVSGSGTYEDGSTATLIATAYEGFHFVQWNDGDTANPRTIVVSADTVLVAHFEADSTEAIADVYTEAGITVTVVDGRIVVVGSTPQAVNLYDAVGHRINDLSGPLPQGIYLIQVGVLPARRVVVVR